MKSWLTKFRISIALDAGRPLPESLQQKIAADAELQRFVSRTKSLGQTAKITPSSDPSLHDSIMGSVRASARREQLRRAPAFSWVAASCAAAAVVVACLWMVHPRLAPSDKSALDGPLLVLEMSEKMPGEMPSMVLAPLSNEWACVNHDVKDTTQILLASFPF